MPPVPGNRKTPRLHTEVREARAQLMRKRWKDPAWIEMMRERHRKLWSQRAYRNKSIRAFKKARATERGKPGWTVKVNKIAAANRERFSAGAKTARDQLLRLEPNFATPAAVHVWELPANLRVTFLPHLRPALRKVVCAEFGYGSRLYNRLNKNTHTHGRRYQNPHSIAIDQFVEISQRTKIPLERLEAAVASVFSNSQDTGVMGAFPLNITKHHAFLMGLWYNAGGYLNREQQIRYRVDVSVVTKVQEAAGAGGTAPHAGQLRVRHKPHMKREVPRMIITLPRVMTYVYQRWGLPPHVDGSDQPSGRKHASRHRHMGIPTLIRADRELLTHFVHGFLQGHSFQVVRRKSGKYWNASVQFTVHALDAAQAHDVMGAFIPVFENAGIHGRLDQMARRNRGYHLRFLVTGKANCLAFLRTFPVYRARAKALEATLEQEHPQP